MRCLHTRLKSKLALRIRRLARVPVYAAVPLSLLLGVSLSFSVGSTASAACPYDANLGSTAAISINIPSTGNYTVWTRMAAPDSTNNTVNLAIDGSSCFLVGGGSFAASSWTSGSDNWVKYSDGDTSKAITMQLNAGQHTFQYMGTKPGVMVDKILFTTDSSCTPVGKADTAGNECPSGDTTPPTVSIVSPTNNQAVSGTVTLSATANDSGSGVKDVTFLVDGAAVGTATGSPYNATWDSSTASNGTHTIVAKATDNSGNAGTSSPVTVTVSGGSKNKVGDLNGDGKININDLSILLTDWGKANPTAKDGDLNGDGKININDLSILLTNWG